MNKCFKFFNKNGSSDSDPAGIEREIITYLIIISVLKKISFCYSTYNLGDVLDKYVQKFNKKIFCAKNLYFALECLYPFLPFNFVIWQVACEYIYSLKHIPFTYFRSIP